MLFSPKNDSESGTEIASTTASRQKRIQSPHAPIYRLSRQSLHCQLQLQQQALLLLPLQVKTLANNSYIDLEELLKKYIYLMKEIITFSASERMWT